MMNTAPDAVIHDWRAALRTAEATLATGAMQTLSHTIQEAAELRDALLAFQPLQVLNENGVETALALAAELDPGRRWLWHALLAGELLDRKEIGQARLVAAELCMESIRIPQASIDMVSTLLPPLYELEPDLPNHLATRGFPINASLRLLGSTGDAKAVLAVARFLEADQVAPLWEELVSEGALEAQRYDLVEALPALFQQTYPDPHMLNSVVLRDPDKRRETVLDRLGYAFLKNGDGTNALAVWSQLPDTRLAFEPAWLAGAGFAAEAEQLLARIADERKRQEAERLLREELAERRTRWSASAQTSGMDRFALALKAARQGDEEEARQHMAEGLSLEEKQGPIRGETVCRVIQVLAALGDDEMAWRLKEKMLNKAETTEKGDERAHLEIALAEAELAMGDIPQAVDRLLRATGYLYDLERAYERLQAFLADAQELGRLDEVHAALPAANEESIYHERFIAYLAEAYARLDRCETAFALANSLPHPSDRDQALSYLILAWLDKDIANAERAALALQGSLAVDRLVEVAAAWHRRGDATSARRVFALATERAGTVIGRIGSVTRQAMKLGYVDQVRSVLSQGLNSLMLEEGEDWNRWLAGAHERSRHWLEQEQSAGGWWFRGLGNSPEPAEPSQLSDGRPSERIRALAQQARYLEEQDQEAAARFLDEALTQWKKVLADKPREQIDLAPILAEAAGPGRAYRLLPRIKELQHHVARYLQDGTRGDWRRNLSWALACLGEWPLAFAAAYAIAHPRSRTEALQWLAWSAPLNAWRGQMRALIEDEPVRLFVISRLRRELRNAINLPDHPLSDNH
ncbi:MAG: hypothetical protein H6970_12420 [Gammaproteobacteria bacterium]|nr:hypothetical protein [Gammaproteobacteria bacterium]MCP5425853.1 hypothetical protein [Gammaproteobacteria bacterium]MCP5458546.1 hypothetical protein [Gammaproteobacteria bacterium]